MLRRDLDAGQILVERKQLHLRRGRHMQHMHALARGRGEPEQLRGRRQRRFRVAPFAVARGIAFAPERSALAQARFILGMEGGAPLDQRQDARQRLLVVDQQIAGGGAHEHFDAGGARKPLEPRQLLDILARGADEEGEVAMHAPAPARDLVGERLGAHRRGLGVRHLEHGGDAAKHRRPAAGFQILLMLEPWLAEMHLGVDDARQDMQAGGIEGPAARLGRRGCRSRRCGRL